MSLEPNPFGRAQEAIVDMLHDYIAEKEHAERLEADNARLKAEVEQLTLEKELDEVDRRNGLCCDAKYRFEELEAQVERLTKAGDVMATMLQFDEVAKDWLAAKKGKQP